MLKTFRTSESYEDSLNSGSSIKDNESTFLGNYSKDIVLEKIEDKKRILLLVDTYDWCFFNISTRIKKEFIEYTIPAATE